MVHQHQEVAFDEVVEFGRNRSLNQYSAIFLHFALDIFVELDFDLSEFGVEGLKPLKIENVGDEDAKIPFKIIRYFFHIKGQFYYLLVFEYLYKAGATC